MSERTSAVVEFITERLDEEEKTSREAADEVGDAKWTSGGEFSSTVYAQQTGTAVVVGPWAGGFLIDALRDHVADQDPARTLRRVEALRKLVRAHVDYYGAGDDESWPIPTLSALAAIWDDHDDYPEVLAG